MPGMHEDHSDEHMDSTDDDEIGWSTGSGAFAMLDAGSKAMVRGPLNDEARALARAAVARALARGEAEALPAVVAVSDWRGLFALALRALRAAFATAARFARATFCSKNCFSTFFIGVSKSRSWRILAYPRIS